MECQCTSLPVSSVFRNVRILYCTAYCCRPKLLTHNLPFPFRASISFAKRRRSIFAAIYFAVQYFAHCHTTQNSTMQHFNRPSTSYEACGSALGPHAAAPSGRIAPTRRCRSSSTTPRAFLDQLIKPLVSGNKVGVLHAACTSMKAFAKDDSALWPHQFPQAPKPLAYCIKARVASSQKICYCLHPSRSAIESHKGDVH